MNDIGVNDTIKIKVKLIEEEYIEIHMGLTKAGMIYKIFVLFPIILASYMIIRNIIISIINFKGYIDFSIWNLDLLIALIVILFIPLIFIFRLKPIVKAIFRSNPNFKNDIFCEFSIDNITTYYSVNFCNNYKWNNIYKIVETKKAFIIYINRFVVLTYPKRCFENEEQINNFKFLYTSNLTKNQIKVLK